ncbi:hypothetical protein [Methanobrevibacter sp.]|uniref:hypothetical protein n=1 Tax=Methanobrevibacter sp. TaxID=66852 RepID=UPI00388D671F
MKFRVISIICLIFVLLMFVNVISATELNNTSLENNGEDINYNYDLNHENNLLRNNNDFDDSIEIYVGQNTTDDGGNGSYDNPYNSFNLAHNYVNNINKSQVTINVFDGVYYLDSYLKFNTSNLIINGLGNDVRIKNYYDIRGASVMAFGLVSSSANFTMNNLIEDHSNQTLAPYFSLFRTSTGSNTVTNNHGIFYNCSFIGPSTTNKFLTGGSYDCQFINCYISSNKAKTGIFTDKKAKNTNLSFKNCIFNLPTATVLMTINLPCNVTLNDVWFGQNNVPGYITPGRGFVIDESGTYVLDYEIPVSRYAIFSVTENYLGDNQFEIIGKLTWNGTEDQDGMENFQPMTVNLVSATGDINQTATLVNGNFRTIYTSSNSTHKVTATLHNEEIELEFTTVNITANPVSIYYGEDQNITFNFTQPITANVTVTVSNGSYNKSERVEIIGKDSLVYTVSDTLKEGIYDVEINLAENNLFGFNTTTLTVSKVSDYTFEVATGDVKVGDNATISITLPDDVTGTVIIKFGNDTKELPANQTMTVNFTNLNATTYSVTVSYRGNDKYVALDKPASVTVNKADSVLEIEDATFTYGDVIAIPFNVTNANGVTVSVLNKDDKEVATASSESGTINLDSLSAGKYTLEATTIVGSNYEWVSKTIDLTINKANSSLDVQDKEFTYAAEAVINAVCENSTGDVIATLTDENNAEIAVTVSGDNITLPKLNTGKYTLTVTTNPDENHTNITKTATITINKANPSMNVIVEPVENITTKDDVTLTISLPSDATGEVTVKINGKKADTISANETITINLNNQAGDYVVDVTYSGDKNYESDITTKEYTVSKVETSITANPIIFEEGNTSTIEVNIPNVDSGFILVDVNGKKFYGDINTGKATVLIEGLVAGNYTANIIFAGDEKFNKSTGTVAVNVTPTVDIISELNEIIKELNSTIESQAKEISNLTDTVAIQNSTIESQAKEIDSLNATVNNQSSTIESQKEQIGNLTKQIDKKDVVLVVNQTFTRAAVDYNAGERGGMFYAILKDNEDNVLANKTVQIAINGKIYNRTSDNEGKASIQVNFASANTYSYAVSFQGDDQYNAAPIAVSKLTVTKKKTTIKASNKVFKAKTKTKKISVTLKTVKNQYDKKTYLKSGKKVTLKVNGKTYTAKINKKGVAKFTIKITKKGKYTAKIKFAGDKTYKASSKTIKIRIK